MAISDKVVLSNIAISLCGCSMFPSENSKYLLYNGISMKNIRSQNIYLKVIILFFVDFY